MRSVIGVRLHCLYSGMLSVGERYIKVLKPAFITAGDSSSLVVTEIGESLSEVGGQSIPVHYRPIFRKSQGQPEIPHTRWGNFTILSGSEIDLARRLPVTSVAVFEQKTDKYIRVDNADHSVPVVGDVQVTFYCGEFAPFSIWAADSDFLVFSRDIGLTMEPSLGLRQRLELR